MIDSFDPHSSGEPSEKDADARVTSAQLYPGKRCHYALVSRRTGTPGFWRFCQFVRRHIFYYLGQLGGFVEHAHESRQSEYWEQFVRLPRYRTRDLTDFVC